MSYNYILVKIQNIFLLNEKAILKRNNLLLDYN